MSRLFTFGCSFTKYDWPTWANIMAEHFKYPFYNYARAGAGNFFIFNRLVHAVNKHNINSDDVIMIMWTSVTREDRFIDDWITLGNIFRQRFYPDEYVKKYVTVRGCYERDIPLISAADTILSHIGCKYHMMSIVDLDNCDDVLSHKKIDDDIYEIIHRYKNTIDKIKPSVHKILFNYEYPTKISGLKDRRPDYHPLPLEHLKYLEIVLPEYKINRDAKEYALISHNTVLASFNSKLKSKVTQFDVQPNSVLVE